ncbi:hypothetical protein EYF80_060953 [Liparis tanakae]|uniref:Uncharacterized protein n=1 Tax=Liparis tanakae TaxID=230148 RepID=A0A4Z2EJY7_9TELE|nr:hypothetical protein EYF80_060953 [Liparis tanakae]
MDSSPQTPDADTSLAGGPAPTPDPGATRTHHTAHTAHTTHTTTHTLMPPPRDTGRPSSARSRGQQGSAAHSTSLQNDKNRIVRSKSDGQKSPSDSVFLRLDEIPYIREDRCEADAHTGHRKRKKSREGEKTPEDISDEPLVKT